MDAKPFPVCANLRWVLWNTWQRSKKPTHKVADFLGSSSGESETAMSPVSYSTAEEVLSIPVPGLDELMLPKRTLRSAVSEILLSSVTNDSPHQALID